MIDLCPLCQTKLIPNNSMFDVRDYFEYKCPRCYILHMKDQPAFYLTQHGTDHSLLLAGIAINNLKLYYQSNRSTIFEINTIIDWPRFNLEDPLRSLERPTYKRLLSLPSPRIDFSKPIDPDQLFNRMKVWLAFS